MNRRRTNGKRSGIQFHKCAIQAGAWFAACDAEALWDRQSGTKHPGKVICFAAGEFDRRVLIEPYDHVK